MNKINYLPNINPLEEAIKEDKKNSALVRAIEVGERIGHANGSNKKLRTKTIMTILFAGFIITLLFMAAIGVLTYKSIADTQVNNNKIRLSTSLLINEIRGSDVQNAIQIKPGPQGSAFILKNTSGEETYEVRIYKYDDYIVQEYTLENTPFSPSSATILGISDKFIPEITNNLLTITTDEGSSCFSLHSNMIEGAT